MKSFRRILDERAGFIKDVSDLFAVEAWKNPELIPNLAHDKTLFVFSDYSQGKGPYKTYSFFIIGRSSADYFNGARKILRDEFGLRDRRISFKSLSDKIKLRAIPAFLSIAGATNGLLVTFAVHSSISSMFVEEWLQALPEYSILKKHVFEDMLRIIHFGAQSLALPFVAGQNIVWFTDCDAIVANKEYQSVFCSLAQVIITKCYLVEEAVGKIGFGLTASDDETLEIEDFVAVPDLVAGTLREVLNSMAKSHAKIVARTLLIKPSVANKADVVCEWLANSRCPLRKLSLVFDRFGSGQYDWRPTTFQIESTKRPICEVDCNIASSTRHISVPVRFDFVD